MPTCSTNPQNNYEKFRYSNKALTNNERNLFKNYWEELINRYGTKAEYYVYNYSLTAHDFLYGEQPTASFAPARAIIMMIDLPSEALLLSKFGIQTDSDMTSVVTIEDFREVFGATAEPKSGDVIRLVELGWDSSETNDTPEAVLSALCLYKDPDNPANLIYPTPGTSWVRCPQLYEITERRHQDFSLKVNTLLGHYVWVLRGKRFDYSYQPGISSECLMGDVGEETRTGLLSGGTQDQSPDKDYPGNIEEESDELYDYNNPDLSDNTSPYGTY